ncbi:hypothetical protein G6F59_018581 [Rhizopus arrhizus]|nr:hypothetical protein G6F59_018581 [Rhizopus arrhizus]
MDRRIQVEMPSRTMDSRNGRRQPQLRKSSLGRSETIRNTPVARIRPMGLPYCGADASNVRHLGGACSAAISTAPPHSPPTAMPCTSRNATSRMTAARPME